MGGWRVFPNIPIHFDAPPDKAPKNLIPPLYSAKIFRTPPNKKYYVYHCDALTFLEKNDFFEEEAMNLAQKVFKELQEKMVQVSKKNKEHKKESKLKAKSSRQRCHS